MRLEFHEEVDFSTDPLELLLRREEEEMECDILESNYRSGLHRSHPERNRDDDPSPTYH